MKYDTYAKLNKEGLKQFGEIFEDGYVPLRSIVGEVVILEQTSKKHSVYMVATEKMTATLLDQLIYRLSKKFKSTKEEVKTEIIKNGLPLREELVALVGTNRMDLFT